MRSRATATTGKPLTLEAGIVRVADALDMEQRPLAHPVRARLDLDPLPQRGRDRGRCDQGRRAASGPDRDHA